MLNNTQIFEKIFGDELIIDIIGCLECTFWSYCFQLLVKMSFFNFNRTLCLIIVFWMANVLLQPLTLKTLISFWNVLTTWFIFWSTDDPDAPHVHHRNFLKEHVVFKEVHCFFCTPFLPAVIVPLRNVCWNVFNVSSVCICWYLLFICGCVRLYLLKIR